MATNKNALIRYKTIDLCLQNRGRTWTLVDLIDACSDALYEAEGKDVLVSKRTVQLDIQHMRSDKLGYNAPIIVYDRKYYTYSDPDYSITSSRLTSNDLGIISESIEILRQFKDFSLFNDLHGIIQKLEDKIHNEHAGHSIIHIEKNEHLRGLEHLDTLYQAILKKIVLVLSYQSFKSRRKGTIIFHPYILKEYNNRWFVIGRQEGKTPILTLALDRIESIDMDLKTPYKQHDFNPDTYYENTYGVTVLPDDKIMDVVLWIDRSNAPYVRTKPFHHSQCILETHRDRSITISLRLHHNYELERLILGFGAGIEVRSPRRLKQRIKKQMRAALERYDRDEEAQDKA